MPEKIVKITNGTETWEVPEAAVAEAEAGGWKRVAAAGAPLAAPTAPVPTPSPTPSPVPKPIAAASIPRVGSTSPAAPSDPGFFASITRGLVPPEEISKRMTDMTPEQLRKWSSATPDSVDESPAHAATRTFGGGLAADVSDELSGFTSPLSLTTLALGPLGKLVGRTGGGLNSLLRAVGRTSRAANLGLNLGGGVVGAEQVADAAGDIKEKGLTPENARELLQGGSQVASAAPVAAQIGRTGFDTLRGAKTRTQQVKGVEAALPKAKPDTEAMGAVVNRNLDELRVQYERSGRPRFGKGAEYSAAGTKTPGGYENFVNLIDGAVKHLESKFAPVLKQHGGKHLNGNPIAQALEAEARTYDKTMPDVAEAIRGRAANYRGKWLTLNELNTERQRLNSFLASFEEKGSLAQGQSIDKNAGDVTSMKIAADKVRDMLYGELQRRSGQDFTPLKQQESDLISLRMAAGKELPSINKAQAAFEAKGYYGRLKESAGEGLALKSAGGIIRRAIPGLVESPEKSVGRYLKHGFAPKTSPSVSNADITKGTMLQNAAMNTHREDIESEPEAPAPASAAIPPAIAAAAGIQSSPAPAASAPAAASSKGVVGQSKRLKDGRRVIITAIYPDGTYEVEER